MTAQALPAGGDRPRLLLVEDEESILFALRKYLSVQGFAVDCAPGRREAEEQLQRERYAAVVADLCLQGCEADDGLDLVLHVHAAWPETRIVLLTAHGSPHLEEEARSRGADAFLHKPQPLADLKRILLELIGGAVR